MKIKKERGPFLGPLLKKLAPKVGARVYVEPIWGYAGQIIFKNGRTRYFRYNSLDLNLLGATEISKDKDYANFFMGRLGYPTVPGSKAFFSDAWCQVIHSRRDIHAAYAHAKKLGFPVIVKPNSGSKGVGVAKVFNKKEFYKALRSIFTIDRIALVQKPLTGKDYRLVVLDSQVISAYERTPLMVSGNGRSNIRQLLVKKQKEFKKNGRDTEINFSDSRILSKLKQQRLSFVTVLPKNTRVYLLDNANLSSGGDSVDVTHAVHPEFKKIATRLTKDMGLRLCGVDLIVEGDIIQKPKKYWVLETNAAPGLDHYVTSGKKQQKIVESLYLQVLKSMAK
ncbi:cyanophycin synthetase [Acetobacteraceae bacterium]|nr:cyanophycin synthetase [Candidatus Parcubacteria bacterium]